MSIRTVAVSELEQQLKQSKQAFYQIATLSSEQKNQALETFARLLEAESDFLLSENAKDIAEAQKDGLSASLFQRLKLDAGKMKQLVQGIRDLIQLEDPAGRVLARTLLDDGLILEKQSVPLGVIGIIFESRPDVMPQILSLILKSGNAVVLKGGQEAKHSNRAFMQLVTKLNQACSFLPEHWATLLDNREAVQEMLAFPQYVDLVIPRGSNQLVQHIMANTKIPVLGHADGVCHLYIHSSASIEESITLAIDAKTQYPAACNALETLLVDGSIADQWLPVFAAKAQETGILLKGCAQAQQCLPELVEATEADWRAEYGDLTLAIKVVSGLQEAVAHINQYGSHHTDAIAAQDANAIEMFLNTVDSACVFANASTRFADGFRFGFGAEIGISTSKTHARGPVGLDGLVIYKYKLRGQNHTVKDYVGTEAKPFKHQPLP